LSQKNREKKKKKKSTNNTLLWLKNKKILFAKLFFLCVPLFLKLP
jgi:hypothetical protein